MAVSASQWLGVIEADYLAGFVPAGGAAMKFAIADPAEIADVSAGLEALAGRHGLMWAPVDTDAVKLHMMQDLFFAVSRQIDWPTLAQGFVEKQLDARAYDWPRPGQPATFQEVADVNDIAAPILERDVKQWLTAEIWNDPLLNQDFRAALMRLCLNRFADPPSTDDPILHWLTGELRRISVLRGEDIFTKINRANARSMLASLTRWLAKAGVAGLVIRIDLSHLALKGAEAAGGLKYSKAAVMDAYEVLRQLIDDIDHHERLMVFVIGTPGLIDGHEDRVIGQYQALQMRIWNEVRPAGRDNPAAPLVWLTP